MVIAVILPGIMALIFPWMSFFFFLLMFTLLMWGAGWIIHRGWIRQVILNLAVLASMLSVFEGVFLIIERKTANKKGIERVENVYQSEDDPVLGWRLIKNTSRLSRKYVNDRLIYEARISIDSNGLRITPRCVAPEKKAVLFFGNSCTYGEGLCDSLTLPYQFGSGAMERYQAYNFGVYGYGPHHMLAQIATGMVDSVVREPVEHVVLQLLYPEHVYRMLGYYDWNIHSPQYTLDASGQPVFRGRFPDAAASGSWWKKVAGSSASYRYFTVRSMALEKNDKELFVAVLLKAKEMLDEKYGHPEFHLILWDWSDGKDGTLFGRLKKEGIRVYDIREIFPGDPASLEYRISAYDKHPNGTAYRLMSDYLFARMKRHK